MLSTAWTKRQKKGDQGYQPLVEIRTKNHEKSIEINVADNGGRSSRKVQDKIFQPFFTTKPTGSGTGLGLSLSYDIVKAHGGELSAESPPAGRTGKETGTVFMLQLPNHLS